MKSKASNLEVFGYCCMGLSVLLFIAGLMSFDSPSEWDSDRIAHFMQDSMLVYIILASFCFVGALMSANAKDYSTAIILSIIPTIGSLCFSMFGAVCENNFASWLLMFFSSLGIYPTLYIDKKLTTTCN